MKIPRWLEFGSYVVLALGAVSAALVHSGHVVGDGVDLYGTFWFYWWIERCILGLQSPDFTDLFFYPLGKDIFAHTGNNFVDAVAAQPFQAVFGFPDYQPWFIAAMLLGNALCFRPLARDILGAGPGAWLATMLWQVAPFTLFECMTGRLTQAFLWFLPLAVLHFLRAGRADHWVDRGWLYRAKSPVLAGVFTALCGWTYWFLGFFLALSFVWLGIVELARDRARWRPRLGAWALAGLACLLCVAPAAVGMAGLADGGAVPGLVTQGGGGIFDPPEQLSNNVAASLHGLWLMETLGQPMLGHLVWGGGLVAVLLLGPGRWRWGGLALWVLAFSVGPVLPIGEHGTVMPHYMLLYRYVPFFDRLWFPYRMVVMVHFALALGIGGVVQGLLLRPKLASMGPKLGLGLALGIASLATAEQHRWLAWPLLHRDLTPPAVYSVIGEQGGALIELPIGLARISIAYQPAHGQPTFGGMGENAPIFWPAGFKRRMSNSFVRLLRDATRKPDEQNTYRDVDRDRLEAEGYRWVVLDRHLVDSDIHRHAFGRKGEPDLVAQAPFMATERVSEALGDPVMVEGALVVWDLLGTAQAPAAMVPTPASLGTRSWPVDDMPEYERLLIQRGRLPEHP